MGIVKGGGADRDRATDPILELNQCVHARTFVTGGGFHLPVSASDLGHRRPLFWEIILYCHPFTPNGWTPRLLRLEWHPHGSAEGGCPHKSGELSPT
jgi:hypothetical protein